MKKALVRTLFTCFALVAIASNAEEDVQNEDVQNTEKNVVVDSRPLSPEKKKIMEKNRKAESEVADAVSEEEDSVEVSSLIIPIKDKEYIALASNQMNHTAISISPSLFHWIDNFPQDNIIKTEDGAEWIFDNSNNYLLRTWHLGDTIVITPKGRWIWGSNYSYVMTNKDLGTSIDVNLFLGPVAFGNYSTWIVGIDKNLGQIYLLNGQGERTVWEVSNVDLYLFQDWEVNDTLIVGQNDSWLWWFSSYNHIILNVNMNHNVRARQMSSNPNYISAIGMRG